MDSTTTRQVANRDLDHSCVLVGESGGHSAVYDAADSSLAPGLLAVRTEHGELLLDPDGTSDVVAE